MPGRNGFYSPPVLGLAGGATVLGAVPIAVRPAQATPAIGVRDPSGDGRSRGEARQDQARRAAARRERQYRGDDGQGRKPDDGQGFVRRSMYSPKRTRSPMSANSILAPRRQGANLDPCAPRRQRDGGSHRKCRTARSGPTGSTSSSRWRLPRGAGLMPSPSSTYPPRPSAAISSRSRH